ncbi:class I adenylate-forming enzyme family protein [Kribbia dieselivorans]|uniref:class I adenylate-forming enzyme family protein n=1 Tax=Kribbia dieselivorans TaxID=331526 RepID=UPI0009F9610E|nr:AMP-binding protein [Kribbia dieselivorans]
MTLYWPEGIPRHLDYPAATVGDLIAGAAATYPTQTAIVDGDLRLGFGDLYAQACRLANALRADGVRDGDVVMLHAPNSAYFLVAYFGVLLSGATVSPVNPLTPPAGLVAQITDTSTRVIITHPAHAAPLLQAVTTVRRAQPELAARLVLLPTTDAAPDGPGETPLTEFTPLVDIVADRPSTRPVTGVGPESVAHIVYTGGTTGTPKGVRVLHRNVTANVTQMIAFRAGHALSLEDGAVHLTAFPAADDATVVPGASASAVVSPLFHAHALINTDFLLTCGAKLVISGRFDPEALLETIETERITYITGSPTMWHALLRAPSAGTRDLTSVRAVSSGAAPIDPVTLGRLGETFTNAIVTEGYGLTEGTCVVTAIPALSSVPRRAGTVGIPVCDTEIQLRDPNGNLVPEGERGELFIKGPQVTAGYLNRPEATAEQFADGWLATGDVALIDDGFLRIVDRAKDMLIYKGYNVYPRELEELLLTHPDVLRVAVVGREDEVVGQEPIAFVVASEAATSTAEDLMAWVAERVLPYKKIRGVQFVAALPTTSAGKILKTELREQVKA